MSGEREGRLFRPSPGANATADEQMVANVLIQVRRANLHCAELASWQVGGLHWPFKLHPSRVSKADGRLLPAHRSVGSGGGDEELFGLAAKDAIEGKLSLRFAA